MNIKNFIRNEKSNKIKNNYINGNIRIVIVYPNYYYLGMSSLGFQSVYNIINSINGVQCERAFLSDFKKSSDNKTISIETKTPIEYFDIIAFSISFENDAINLISIINKTDLSLFSNDRDKKAPLILAGGVLSFLNPETIAPFVDCFFIGEIENILEKFFQIFQVKKDKKINLINLVKKLPNFYVPAFYNVSYNKKLTINKVLSNDNLPLSIKKSTNYKINENPINTSVISDETVFSDTFLVEMSRGCHHGCRFCGAGYIYRPSRFQSYQILKKQISDGLKLTKKIGLIGSSISDHPNLNQLCSEIKDKNIRLSISSLRADLITKENINNFKKNKIKTATIAPDAGSERLRRVINKGITEKKILDTIKNLVLGGIPNIKMYFMVGLPTETYEDLKEIISICKKSKNIFLKNSRGKKRIGKIIISINPFIPKAFTPFQWSPMEKINILKKKINLLRKRLKPIPNIIIQTASIRSSYIQALIARGDRKIANFLFLYHKNKYNYSKTLKEINFNPDFYVYRQRNFDEIFPWDFIKKTVKKKFLLKEFNLSLNNLPSKSCYKKEKKCNICGVCKKQDRYTL